MYRTIRRIHLISGMILALITLMYALSGFLFIHPGAILGTGTKENRSAQLSLDAATLADDGAGARVAAAAQEAFDLRGRARSRRQDDGSWELRFDAAGAVSLVTVASDGAAAVEVRRGSAMRVFQRLHRVVGYDGGAGYYAWALLVDLTSLALIAFAVSGVYLWLVLRGDRFGWALLLASSAFTIGSVVWLAVRK